MPKSIDQISKDLGIREVSGSFDFELNRKLEEGRAKGRAKSKAYFVESQLQDEKDEVRQEALAQQFSTVTPEVKTSLPDKTRKRGEARIDSQAKDKGKGKATATKPFEAFQIRDELVEQIRSDERKSDAPTRTYEEEVTAKDGTKTTILNIGNGLRMDTDLTKKLLADQGLDIDKIRDSGGVDYLLDGSGPARLERVYRQRLIIARQDAIKYVGNRSDWDELEVNQKDALINLSYNLGLSKLMGFVKTRALVKSLVAVNKAVKTDPSLDEGGLIKDKLLEAIRLEMLDSTWAGQVGERSERVTKLFSQGAGYAQRWEDIQKSILSV